jgi:predicted DNA-binding antitoxin AbrB/MazE fold protein
MAFTSLSDLRKSRGGFDSLMKEVEKIANPKTESNNRNDDRFWQPEVDKAGNGYAVIRFLAPPKGEELPWVRIWNHGFQGPTGKWYIENSLTTVGKQDPVSELNTELWNSGSEANKEVARKQKRKLTYYTNILIVQDSKHPENEGKVFLFKFGKKIFDKIKDVAEPQFEDEKPLNPFDFWEGANFKLKIRNVEGYRNYDKSEFDSPSPVSNDDSIIEAIWSKQHSLTAFLEPKNFKSYDELKKKLTMVLSNGAPPVKPAESVDLDEGQSFTKPATQASRAPAPTPKKDIDFEDDDESLSYFSKLASDD